MTTNDLSVLVNKRMENLRPKLLDLTRRNPLIAAKLGPRLNSHIRVVDELPELIFYKLKNGRRLLLLPLPAIDDDPRDEQTSEFREALINARLTDERYLAEMVSTDRDAEEYIDQSRQLERSLKDRVREELGLSPRAKKTDFDRINHAKINGVTPSYELPTPTVEDPIERHTDDDIQTLLLPNELERKLNAIVSKCRTWMQETGINVLQIAYGFLEWSDLAKSETSLAPLILSEVSIEKMRTTQGVKFWIRGAGEDPTINNVLVEKLRLDFGIELPVFNGSSIEEYFSEVAKLAPSNMTLHVRRQVAIGVFPSARMAMYHDLDTKQPGFPNNDIVHALLGGTNEASASPFADEYEIDEPGIESKVPYIVMDADSSQFSALVDVSGGKNVAIEGPPGTGKSQTIVNAIAAALADGKKVLFVAEKLAALDVVKSRLEAIGLGEFLLPLQAERSTREKVIASVRARLEMSSAPAVRDFEAKLSEYRQARDEIAKYLELMTRPFGSSGLTTREVLGKSLATNPTIGDLPTEVLEKCEVPQSSLTATSLAMLRKLGARLAKALQDTTHTQAHWKGTKLLHPDRFTIEEACQLARRASQAFIDLSDARDRLNDTGLAADSAQSLLAQIDTHLEDAHQHAQVCGFMPLANLLRGDNTAVAKHFLERGEACRRQREQLSRILTVIPDGGCVQSIQRILDLCNRLNVDTIDPATLEKNTESTRNLVKTACAISASLAPFVKRRPESRNWGWHDIAKAHALIKETGRDALLIRNASASWPDAPHLLQRLCDEGKQLQAQKAELAGKISLVVELSPERLVDTLSTIRTANLFSIFSRKFRQAKKLFLSISRDATYEKQAAIETLESLIIFQRREAAFIRGPRIADAFGSHFRGLETEFERFERLARFYTALESHFCSSEQSNFRVFLAEADIAELELLPAIPVTEARITYSSLPQHIQAAEIQIHNLKAAAAALTPLVHIFIDPKSITPPELVRLLNEARRLVDEEAELDRCDEARVILGEMFTTWRASLEMIDEIVRWALSARFFESTLCPILVAGRAHHVRNRIRDVLNSEQAAEELLNRVSAIAKIERACFTDGCSMRDTARRLDLAANDPDGLFTYASLATALTEASPYGVLPVVDYLVKTSGSLTSLANQFEALGVRQLAKAVYASIGAELSKYRGHRLDELRALLAERDLEIIQLSRKLLRAKIHASAQPPRGNGVGRRSTWTEMALIENEIAKRRNFLSVRNLTQRSGRALLELKPCWMMSPLAVAQYVPKESIHFDLCIIDEASQMHPESAIGALLRCNQAVIVGDTNQLPPTTFFKTLIEEEDSEDEAVLDESILEIANATFRPKRLLRWHYRSRHSDLIKFSNKLVYNDKLIVFPSPTESGFKMGVQLRHLNGRYKAGTNPIEAKAMVEAALEFMRTDPDRSLGIVTLNHKQRDLISEEFEYLVGKNRHALQYIEAWKERNCGLEEFFIKNLENVQGDERDVIFIGTVYGPEEPGARVMQRFGPVSGLAGKRRLNVLFTRAREKIITFSSMTASDVMADEHRNPGAYMLKRWLEYSASGMLESGESTGREPDSDFEIFVMEQIQSMGCEAVPQVGVAGYFVDIGVRHQDWPHGFILGVECDGANYHSAKSARDRDRLRQKILEDLGWRLHRIWSTDWFNNPRREAEKLRVIISGRLEELKRREWDYIPSPHAETGIVPDDAPEPAEEAAVFSVGMEQEQGAQATAIHPNGKGRESDSAVVVGDTVRVKFLTGDQRTLQITISRTKSDPSQGFTHCEAPLAKALIGSEVGDEVEVLVGSYVRSAVVEHIIKGLVHA